MSDRLSAPSAPPKTLTQDLELAPADWQPTDVYYLMTGLVIPRPIAWVSTVSNDGVHNLAPYSYFNAMGHNPPAVVFGSGGVKDSLRNIQDNGEFVVNLVTEEVLEKMNFTSTDFPPEHSEFSWAELTKVPSKTVKPPRVREAKAHLECRLNQVATVGAANIIIGEVTHIHIDQSVWHEGRVDPERLKPVCRLAGSWYAKLGELVYLKRPKWSDVQSSENLAGMPRVGDKRD